MITIKNIKLTVLINGLNKFRIIPLIIDIIRNSKNIFIPINFSVFVIFVAVKNVQNSYD